MSETGAAPTAAPASAPSSAAPAPAPANDNATPAEAAKQPGTPSTPGPASTSPQPPSAPEVHEVKIDGKAHRVKAADVRRVLGMKPDEPITDRDLRALSAEVSSRRRFEDAARQRKEAESFRELAAKDPFAALVKSFNGDEAKAEAALMEHLARKIEERALPQQEQQARQRARELEERERRVNDLEAKQREAAEAQQAKADQERYHKIFSHHLKLAGLPVSPATIGRMAGVVEGYMAQGIDPNTIAPEQITAQVRAEIEAEAAAYVQALPPDALAKLLGKRRDELRAADVKELSTSLGERPRRPDGTFASVKEPEAAEPKSTRKVMAEIRARYGEK